MANFTKEGSYFGLLSQFVLADEMLDVYLIAEPSLDIFLEVGWHFLGVYLLGSGLGC